MTLLQSLEVPQEGETIPDRWINSDIEPIQADRRRWGFWTFNNYCSGAWPYAALCRSR